MLITSTKTVRQCFYKHLLIHFHHEIALGYKNTKSGLTYNQYKSDKIFNCDLSSRYRNLSPTRTLESMTNCYILYLAFMISKCKMKPLEYGPHSPKTRVGKYHTKFKDHYVVLFSCRGCLQHFSPKFISILTWHLFRV